MGPCKIILKLIVAVSVITLGYGATSWNDQRSNYENRHQHTLNHKATCNECDKFVTAVDTNTRSQDCGANGRRDTLGICRGFKPFECTHTYFGEFCKSCSNMKCESKTGSLAHKWATSIKKCGC